MNNTYVNRIKQLNHKFLRALCTVLFTICIGNANADDCVTPGYYVNASGNCVQCDEINHYCPGDGEKHACPDFTDADVEFAYSDLTARGYNIKSVGRKRLYTQYSYNTNNLNSITRCIFVFENIDVDQGILIYRGFSYSTDTNSYSRPRIVTYWSRANPGYYVSDIVSSNNKWYHNINACTNAPNNAYYTGAGTPDVGNCPWECDSGYVKTSDGLHCTSDVGNSGFCIPSSFTITYICPNGGNTPATRTVSHGANFTTADASVCNGDYDVWRADDGMNTKITSNTTLTYPYFKNITLTATKRNN